MDGQLNITEIDKITKRLESSDIPPLLHEKAQEQIDRIKLTLKYGGNLSQLDITAKYIDWITHLPWNAKTQDILDLTKAITVLNTNHFGLDGIKKRILEYLSLLIVQRQKMQTDTFRAPSLFFIGLAGTGKTTFAISIAEALGRSFIRIPFGGLSSALDLRGQSKTSPEAEPGMIMRALRRAGSKNPVILLDELDRITPESKASIMGVLIELLDPGQNNTFTDYFIDYPFDLSQVLFIATANNTNSISTAVMDRLEVIQMPSYTDVEKVEIAKQHVLPRLLKEAGLTPDMIQIDNGVWDKIIRPLGFDSGIRTLERTIETIIRKATYRMVSGEKTPFYINESNLKEFLSS